MTLTNQVNKLKRRFGLERVVVVGDRGMITSARITEDLEPAGLDWITALRAPKIETRPMAARCNCRCSTTRHGQSASPIIPASG